MHELENKQVLVIGLGSRGRAACELLRHSGANVLAIDEADTVDLRADAGRLRPLGVEVELGVTRPPNRQFNLAVFSSSGPAHLPILREVRDRHVPVIGECELGYQHSQCLSIAVAGTNGKGTTAEMIRQVLTHDLRKTAMGGDGARPVCSLVPQSKELDFLVLQLNSFQLEMTSTFRPSVAVLMNLAPDHLDCYESPREYFRATARLFENQQPFDWTIIQSEALAELRALAVPIPAKVITFSATDREADIYLDRGLLISRLPGWSGPLLDMEQCEVGGVHNAENLMAVLAVGHVLHVPLEGMKEILKAQRPLPHCFETVATGGGVRFINDSKATNVDALHKALLSLPAHPDGSPNVWLIAGGKCKGLDYHGVGPMISERVKRAFLIGDAGKKILSAWALFTPCAVTGTLLEAITTAAKNAVPGDVILLSPACSSFDQFRNYQHRGEVFRDAARALAATMGGGNGNGHHNKRETAEVRWNENGN
jgi:UDP-N-acetylmuramoylalanine--D-glutamate ligase